MKTIDVTAPFDGAVIGKVPVSTGSDVKEALSTATPFTATEMAGYRHRGELDRAVGGIGGLPHTIHDMRTEKMMGLRSDEL